VVAIILINRIHELMSCSWIWKLGGLSTTDGVLGEV
jgi:hypothetical protein